MLEIIQVCDWCILIVLDELNTLIYVRVLDKWQIPKLRHIDVGNFGPKMTLFSAIMSIFSPLRGDRLLLRPQAIAW